MAKRTFVLQGSLKGKTIKLSTFHFNKGEVTIEASEDDLDKLAHHLNRNWQCVDKDTLAEEPVEVPKEPENLDDLVASTEAPADEPEVKPASKPKAAAKPKAKTSK